ncbi:MAG: metalloregulator ArsR/SmtB family transcription factor [Patescibacteria group bacterium]|nr:metalloregulator ArsR/SmtB family transcription factor [Patescibacteria group bacterium]MCL5257977.1 metalloregulator ArsR/SmtB family transcription factor [Patescibacteria group bacterium]
MINRTKLKKIKKSLRRFEKEEAAILFRALADSNRFLILNLVYENTDLCLTDLAKILNLSLSAVSRQGRILTSVGLVEKKRLGKTICYRFKKSERVNQKLIKLFGGKK